MSGTRPVVYIASTLQGLARAVTLLLPQVAVKDIQISEKRGLSDEDKTDIQDNAEVLLGDVPVISSVLYTSKRLRWAQSTWAGVEPLLKIVDLKKPPSVTVTRAGSAFGDLMAEYVLGHIIAKERRFSKMAEHQKERQWGKDSHLNFRSLSELRLGILGVGQIGLEIGRLCKAAGMEVWGLSRTPKTGIESDRVQLDQYRTLDQLCDVLENCHYICNVLPSTPETTGLLSGEVLSHCKAKKSTFINVGRGTVVDEDSLIKAIENNWIDGAILDVFEQEPLSPESKLWSHPNVIITPHIAGPSRPDAIAKTFVSNYKKYTDGEQLDYVVKWVYGY